MQNSKLGKMLLAFLFLLCFPLLEVMARNVWYGHSKPKGTGYTPGSYGNGLTQHTYPHLCGSDTRANLKAKQPDVTLALPLWVFLLQIRKYLNDAVYMAEGAFHPLGYSRHLPLQRHLPIGLIQKNFHRGCPFRFLA